MYNLKQIQILTLCISSQKTHLAVCKQLTDISQKFSIKEPVFLLIVLGDKIFLVLFYYLGLNLYIFLFLVKEIIEVINDYRLMSNNSKMSGEKLHSPLLSIVLFHPSIPTPSQELTTNYNLEFMFSNHFL